MANTVFSGLKSLNEAISQTVQKRLFVKQISEPLSLLSHMPKDLRILHFSVDNANLTHFGGMILLQYFCNKLRFHWLIQKSVKIPQRNAARFSSILIRHHVPHKYVYSIMD